MKRILSFILALTMLLGCSLMVFAAEPCEYCEDGEIHAFGWRKTGFNSGEVTCPDCKASDVKYYVYTRDYICDDCGEIGYSQYYRDYYQCCGYIEYVDEIG